MLKTPLALITSAILGLAATANADLTWDWSYTSIIGDNLSASGTLTTGPLTSGAYTITGISGAYALAGYPSLSIAGLDSVNAVNSPPDNMLYTPGFNGTGDGNQLSFHGLSFDLAFAGSLVGVANVFDRFDAPAPIDAMEDIFGDSSVGYFVAVAAPEPSQIVSMLTLAGVGGAGLLFTLRRRK